jgi:hypothetical protein
LQGLLFAFLLVFPRKAEIAETLQILLPFPKPDAVKSTASGKNG